MPNPPIEFHSTGSKHPSNEALIQASKRRNIKPEKLPEYHSKSRQEHRKWVRDADVAFALTPWNLDDDTNKILWATQSLKSDLKEQWHNKRAQVPAIANLWEYFTTFLLDKVKDPVNRQLDINQEFMDAKQRPSQSVAAFDAYLTSLEAQLPLFTKSQCTSALMTQLRPKLQEAIIRIGTLPVDRNSLLSLAAQLETAVKQSHAQLQGQRSGGALNTKTGGNKGGSKLNKPSQEEQTAQSKKDKKENWKSISDLKSKSKSKDKVCLKNIKCFNCHKKGHYATDCKAPTADNPNNVPVGLVGNMGAHAIESNLGKRNSSLKTLLATRAKKGVCSVPTLIYDGHVIARDVGLPKVPLWFHFNNSAEVNVIDQSSALANDLELIEAPLPSSQWMDENTTFCYTAYLISYELRDSWGYTKQCRHIFYAIAKHDNPPNE